MCPKPSWPLFTLHSYNCVIQGQFLHITLAHSIYKWCDKMTDGDLLARLLPLALQCYNASDSVSNVLQNTRRERARRLKVKKFKWLSQREAIIVLGCSVLFEFLDLLAAWLTCPRVAHLSYISLAILSITLQFCFRLDRLEGSTIS